MAQIMFLRDSEWSESLESCVTLEYTRDSPLFRQSIFAFEDSFSQLSDYSHGVVAALSEYEAGLKNLESLHGNLIHALSGQPNVYGRALFTKALPKLPDVSVTLRIFSELLSKMGTAFEQLRERIQSNVVPHFESLAKETLEQETKLCKEMELNCLHYETLLDHSLLSRKPLRSSQFDAIIKARTDYELTRFDLVERLNSLDCQKKILVNKALEEMFVAFSEVKDSLWESLSGETERHFSFLKLQLKEAEEIVESNKALWAGVRCKLQGEIAGSLPPPGSPLGALSPVQPRPYQGMPLYTVTLTTEVLNSGSRAARYEDLQHARDDGVFRQGFLFVSGGVFSRRRRKWHRLYSSKLYMIDSVPHSLTCNMELVADLPGAVVTTREGKRPYKFLIITRDKRHVRLQAENEDELVRWLQALRRAANRGKMPGRPPSLPSSPRREDGAASPWSMSVQASSTPSSPKASEPAVGSGKKIVSSDDNEDDIVRSGVTVHSQEAWRKETLDTSPSIELETGIEVPQMSPSRIVDALVARENNRGNDSEDSSVASTDSDDEEDIDEVLGRDILLLDNPPSPENVAADEPSEKLSSRHAELSGSSAHFQRLFREFLKINDSCCECGARPVSWISTSLGVTICEQCAAVHRQLTWAVSKLKNITLDHFQDWQIALLAEDMGNEITNELWENSVAAGWTKPEPSTNMQEKAEWILSKYRWFAFVEEYRIRNPSQLVEGMHCAAVEGNVRKAFWWLAHKADVNCVIEPHGGMDGGGSVAAQDQGATVPSGASGSPPFANPNTGFSLLRRRPSGLTADTGEQKRRDSHTNNSHQDHSKGGGSQECKSNGPTPLHVAVRAGHVNLVAFLLLNGADMFAADETGASSYDLAVAGCATSGSSRRMLSLFRPFGSSPAASEASTATQKFIVMREMMEQLREGDY